MFGWNAQIFTKHVQVVYSAVTLPVWHRHCWTKRAQPHSCGVALRLATQAQPNVWLFHLPSGLRLFSPLAAMNVVRMLWDYLAPSKAFHPPVGDNHLYHPLQGKISDTHPRWENVTWINFWVTNMRQWRLLCSNIHKNILQKVWDACPAPEAVECKLEVVLISVLSSVSEGNWGTRQRFYLSSVWYFHLHPNILCADPVLESLNNDIWS